MLKASLPGTPVMQYHVEQPGLMTMRKFTVGTNAPKHSWVSNPNIQATYDSQ